MSIVVRHESDDVYSLRCRLDGSVNSITHSVVNSDVHVKSKPHSIGLYRENAIAIESEASDSLTQTPSIDQSGFARTERNLHCDVHVAVENRHILPPFGSLDSFWITRSQRSRRRDKGLYGLPLCKTLQHCDKPMCIKRNWLFR